MHFAKAMATAAKHHQRTALLNIEFFRMQQITPALLKQWMQDGNPFQLVDVREDFEHEAFNIGGLLIPLGTVMQNHQQVKTDIPVVVYCRKGIRSQIAIQRLTERFGFTNLYNLTGGMERWQRE
jgi:rhodanese-related sulfurtransferase